MKVKSGFILKKVMGSYIIISENDEAVSNMQTLNETGAFLWSLMERDTTISQMCARVIEEYDIDESTAKSDIENFIKKLDEASLLEK